jgi:hypothetical protein
VFFANDVAVSGTTIAKKPRPLADNCPSGFSVLGGVWRGPGLLLLAVTDLGDGL